MTVLDDAAALIRRRLDELSDERIKLERTLVALGGASSPPSRARRPASSGGGAGGRRERRRGPTRKQEVLVQVQANPSIGTVEIARAIGISRSQVSNLLTRLKREGTLKKDRRSKKWVVGA